MFEWSVGGAANTPSQVELAEQISQARAFRNGAGMLREGDDPSWMKVVYQAILPVARFESGRLVEIRVYPIDTNREGTVSRGGAGRLATGTVARDILERLQKLSEPLGTRVSIENNVGIIRPVQATTAQR